MHFRTGFSAAVLLGLLVVLIAICGCTSSGKPSSGSPDTLPDVSAETAAMAGLYKSVEDPSSQIQLDGTGKAYIIKPEGRIAGTFTKENGEIKICTEDAGGRSCFMAPVEADGSFVLGQNTYKQ